MGVLSQGDPLSDEDAEDFNAVKHRRRRSAGGRPAAADGREFNITDEKMFPPSRDSRLSSAPDDELAHRLQVVPRHRALYRLRLVRALVLKRKLGAVEPDGTGP